MIESKRLIEGEKMEGKNGNKRREYSKKNREWRLWKKVFKRKKFVKMQEFEKEVKEWKA